MFRITARTVLELGAELISSDIIAFYELIKNGFDAIQRSGVDGSRKGVDVRFDIVLPRVLFLRLKEKVSRRQGKVEELKKAILDAFLPGASEGARTLYRRTIEQASDHRTLLKALNEAQATLNTITVSDRGAGMSMKDLRDAFLVIGTASRKREVEAALAVGSKEAPFLGEKGIGRLSAMRLGERLRVETAKADDSSLNLLMIDWREFSNIDAMLDEIKVEPKAGGLKPDPAWSGTNIIIQDLLENWTDARVREMCGYEFARLTDPMIDVEQRPRIAIYFNGERISIPFMPSQLLDAAHAKAVGSYRIDNGRPSLTCTVEVFDLGFDHPHEAETVVLPVEDLIGAFVGKEGEIEDQALMDVGPFTFEAYWYNRRRLSRVDSTGENKALRDLQDQWSGILLFRDGFRVFPYGEDEDDWLELDRRALRRSGYTLNKTQFVGRVNISRAENPLLVDQTNREGLRVTPEQIVFLDVIRYAIQNRLGDFMRFVERQYKNQKIDLSDAKTRVASLEERARAAIRKLRRVTPEEGSEAVEDLQQTLLELSDFAAKARDRIAEVEKESRQMIDMAGVGLMVEVVAHELARSSENALKALDRLKGTDVPQNLRAHFKTLRAEMNSVSKRIKILDPLSVSGRQRTEAFVLDDLVRDVLEAHEAQFLRHNVTVRVNPPERPTRVRAVKGMVVQILENLISNSIHWMDIRAEREPTYQPQISITIERGPPTITFEDNGRGIAPENAEKVFRPFFSLKDTKRRRGLGLFIAREAAEYHGGALQLSQHRNPETGRLHRFVFEMPVGAEA
ncbi:sensor histidine kinase [Azospirillum rugosum]|uniref:histidine kinase n=1 Tax=Azospirillum rugosum TaxID=416170 RepID=A0ABS4SWZ2_9PROT|nr:sensor histidine kinase [Azospirillum rugosum]MBP2297069.1 signal transduction histidine kinase [Azospirillum rugosum]MDQ0530883.1 signal transduction histidine kinase [Azospirillum rugosum]